MKLGSSSPWTGLWGWRSRSATIAGLATGLLTLLGLFAQPASAGWQLPATTLSEPGEGALRPDVAIDPTGRTTVVWYGGAPGDFAVKAATRPAGSKTFSTPVDVSEPGPDTGQVEPEVQTGPDGRTVVTWAADGLVWASSRAAGSNSFSEPVQVSLAPGLSALPRVVIHPQYGALIAWQNQLTNDNYLIEFVKEEAPGSNQFTVPIGLSAQGEIAAGVDLTVGSDGRATVVWYRDDGTGRFVAQAATSTANLTSFSSPLNLSSPSVELPTPPQVTSGPDGSTTTVWAAWTGTETVIQSRTRPEGSVFFAPSVNIGPGLPNELVYTNTEIETSPNGDTSAVWSQVPPGTLISTRPARGGLPFGNPLNLATAGNPSEAGYLPKLAIGPGGERNVAWQSNADSLTAIIRTSSVSTAGGLTQTTAPIELSEPGSNAAEIAAGPNGLVTVVWWRRTGPMGTEFVVEQATRMRVPKMNRPVVKGPGKAGLRRKATYRVRLGNVGDGGITGLRITARGKGAGTSKKAGNLAAGKSKTVKLALKFKKKGKVRITFTVSSKNAGKKTVKKVVRVR